MNKSLLLKALKMTYNMPTVTDSTTDCVFCDAKTGIAAHSSAPSEHRFRVYDHEGQSIAVCHTLKDAQTWPEHYSGFKIVERLAAPAPTGESLPVQGVPSNSKRLGPNVAMVQWALAELLGALPERRDWLNPDAEGVLRALKESGGKAVGSLKDDYKMLTPQEMQEVQRNLINAGMYDYVSYGAAIERLTLECLK